SDSSASSTPSAPGLTPTGERQLQRMTPVPSITKSPRSAVPSPARQHPYARATAPLGSKSDSSGKRSFLSRENATWHQGPSTETPSSPALRGVNSGRTSLKRAISSLHPGLKSAG